MRTGEASTAPRRPLPRTAEAGAYGLPRAGERPGPRGGFAVGPAPRGWSHDPEALPPSPARGGHRAARSPLGDAPGPRATAAPAAGVPVAAALRRALRDGAGAGGRHARLLAEHPVRPRAQRADGSDRDPDHRAGPGLGRGGTRLDTAHRRQTHPADGRLRPGGPRRPDPHRPLHGGPSRRRPQPHRLRLRRHRRVHQRRLERAGDGVRHPRRRLGADHHRSGDRLLPSLWRSPTTVAGPPVLRTQPSGTELRRQQIRPQRNAHPVPRGRRAPNLGR